MKTENEITINVPFSALSPLNDVDSIESVDKENPNGVAFMVTQAEVEEIRRVQQLIAGWRTDNGHSLTAVNATFHASIDDVNLTMNGYAFHADVTELEVAEDSVRLHMYHGGEPAACVSADVTALLEAVSPLQDADEAPPAEPPLTVSWKELYELVKGRGALLVNEDDRGYMELEVEENVDGDDPSLWRNCTPGMRDRTDLLGLHFHVPGPYADDHADYDLELPPDYAIAVESTGTIVIPYMFDNDGEPLDYFCFNVLNNAFLCPVWQSGQLRLQEARSLKSTAARL